MRIIQKAKFVLLYHKQSVVIAENDKAFIDEEVSDGGSINLPAILQLDDITLQSATPKSAAEAEKINRKLAEWEGVFK